MFPITYHKEAGLKGMELAELWTVYKQDDDQDVKNELLLRYIYLVKKLVRRMMPKYNCYNDYDDLVNSGIIGLIDAVEKFDLKHNVKFETYAIMRIRGEILDYMRSQDWAPSSLRKKISQINDAYERLERIHGNSPSDESVAQELDMPVTQINKILSQSHVFSVVSFEEAVSNGNPASELPGRDDDIPENALINQDMRKILTELIEELPEKERLVITLYYYEEMMFRDIANILHVSESRVSQIHSKILSKMKAKLQAIM